MGPQVVVAQANNIKSKDIRVQYIHKITEWMYGYSVRTAVCMVSDSYK